MAERALNFKCFQSFINRPILEFVAAIRMKYLDILQISFYGLKRMFYKVCCFAATGAVTNYFSIKKVNCGGEKQSDFYPLNRILFSASRNYCGLP